jgi:hypothetical protein
VSDIVIGYSQNVVVMDAKEDAAAAAPSVTDFTYR